MKCDAYLCGRYDRRPHWAACERGGSVNGETDSLELSDRQKMRLLHLGLEPDRPGASSDPDEQRGDLLCDVLRCSLATDGSKQGERFPGDGVLRPGLQMLAGPSLGALLRDPKTDLAVLRRIKRYAKSVGQDTGSDVEKDVFLAVYFAAIAAAAVFHSERITGHSDEDLIRFFDFFARSPWMPTDMAGLFADAARHRRNAP
jgi:hypothetical protein